MADGGIEAASAVANQQVTPKGYAAKTEMYEVDTACAICQEPYNIGTDDGRPYQTCLLHYLCGKCIKNMVMDCNGGKDSTNSGGVLRTTFENTWNGLKVTRLWGQNDYGDDLYDGNERVYSYRSFPFSCPSCRHQTNVELGHVFMRSADREAHIVRGLNPMGTSGMVVQTFTELQTHVRLLRVELLW